MYRCPGETYDIDRAVHLGRLATFYSKCGDCPHRSDTATLPRQMVRRLTTVYSQAAAGAALTNEGVVGVYRNQLTPARAREYAAALGLFLSESAKGESPAVLVGGDDRPLTPEFIAVACEGLRWAGCRAIDLGTTTAAGLVRGFAPAAEAHGGLLVGNPTGDPHIIGLSFWGTNARPLSMGHGLERIEQLAQSTLVRTTRTYGGFERMSIDAAYLDSLRDDFHALRPLRFVLETGSGPLKRYLRRLTESVACDVIETGESLPVSSRANDDVLGQGASQLPPPALPRRWIAARLQQLGQHVADHSAHFGVWIDGDGETCHVVDERGSAVPGDALLVLLSRHAAGRVQSRPVAVEPTTSPRATAALKSVGATVMASGETRAEMFDRMRDCGAVIGGGPSGRFFHAAVAPPALPAADALKTLVLLLGALSTSDRPLSQVAALS